MTEVLYSADRIADRVRALAGEIRGRYPAEPLTLLGILTSPPIWRASWGSRSS
ncbi:MAG: hypothetical protein ACYTF8_11720 [Planctomycetota bacterium]|jgi:hypoxanthine-guanine phosphoribosyltransferase